MTGKQIMECLLGRLRQLEAFDGLVRGIEPKNEKGARIRHEALQLTFAAKQLLRLFEEAGFGAVPVPGACPTCGKRGQK